MKRALILCLPLWACGAPGAPDPIARLEDERHERSGALIAALADPQPERRARAARAMGRIQSPAYVGPLSGATRDREKPVRLAALFALGQLGLAQGRVVPDAAREALSASLDDPDPEIQAASLEAVGKLAGPGAPGRVVPFLAHGSPDVRSAAATALFRCRFAPLWRGETSEAPPLPKAAVAALIEALNDDEASVRRAVAHAFSRYGQPEAAMALTRRAQDADEWVRLFAVRAIGRSEHPGTAEPLVRALSDASARIRTEAVTALATLGLAHEVPPRLASDPSFHVRAAVARAMGGDTSATTIGTLRDLVQDGSATVRGAALEALARRLGSGFRQELERALADADWRIRAAASGALGHLCDAAAAWVPQAMADPDVRVRTAALPAIVEMEGGPEIVDETLDADDLALRGTAVALFGRLELPDKIGRLAAVYDASAGVEWIEVREAIVDALGGGDDAEGLLRRMARDDASSVRLKARAALGDRGVDVADEDGPSAPASRFLGREFDEDPLVVLETSKGDIEIRCLAREAPNHVASFVDRVAEGFYDGLIWHRVVSNFVIQGGDPRGDGWGSGGYALRDEINTVRYDRGTVGMPKAGKDTGGCQLFITHVPTPHLDGNYTVFGRVVSDLEVIDRIEVGDEILRARLK